MWCGDVVVSNCVLVVLSSFGELCRYAAFSCRGRLVGVVFSSWCRRFVVWCGGPCLKSVPVSCDKYIATGKSGAFNDRASPILKMGKIRLLFGEPWQILVSGTGFDFFFFSFVFVFFFRVCVVWRGEEGVCTFKTSPCVPAPREHVEKRVDVVPVHTETF